LRECNRIFRDVASRLDNFVRNIGKGKVVQKFLKDFLGGLLCNRNVLLSEISRGNKKDVLLKKQIERLGNRLASFSYKEVLEKYHVLIKDEINERTIFCIDNTDIIKPHGTKFEHLSFVRDGSTGRIEKGYEVMDITALSHNHRQPIPIYSFPFAYNDKNYQSNNCETERGLDLIRQSFGPIGIKVFDRGYDDCKLMRSLSFHNEKFIIRAKENRHVVHQGTSIPIKDLISQKNSAKYSYYTRRDKKCFVTFKKYPISIDNISLNLITVAGFGEKPLLLYTNLDLDKELEFVVTKVYILRWKIEEKFKFEKQTFHIENFRVRKLAAIRALVMLTSILCGFISIMCEHQKHKLFRNLFRISQTLTKKQRKNHLFLYSITRAVSDLYKVYFSSG